jgi:hypothetical protein
VERLPVQPLAPGLLALLKLRVCGLDRVAPDQRGNQKLAAAVGKRNGKLPFGGQSGHEPEDLLWSLARIGHDHKMSSGRPSRRLDEQPLRGNAIEHGPTDLVDTVSIRLRNERRVLVVSKTLQPGRQSVIDGADDLAQPIAVVRDGNIPGRGRRRVVLPETPRA